MEWLTEEDFNAISRERRFARLDQVIIVDGRLDTSKCRLVRSPVVSRSELADYDVERWFGLSSFGPCVVEVPVSPKLFSYSSFYCTFKPGTEAWESALTLRDAFTSLSSSDICSIETSVQSLSTSVFIPDRCGFYREVYADNETACTRCAFELFKDVAVYLGPSELQLACRIFKEHATGRVQLGCYPGVTRCLRLACEMSLKDRSVFRVETKDELRNYKVVLGLVQDFSPPKTWRKLD